MPKTINVAPGRKRLDKPKLKGIPLLATELSRLEWRYREKILQTPINTQALCQYKDKIWAKCEAVKVDEYDKIAFFASRLYQMIEAIDEFQNPY